MVVISPAFSYEDYLQLPDDGKRYEVLEGELVVSPSPKRKHQRVVGKLFNYLTRAEQAGYGEAYVAPFDVIFDPYNITQPDVLFVSRERLAILTEDNVQGAPDLVVEILSQSTRSRDFGAKLRIYARHGVRYYWIVDPQADTLQPYEWREDGYHRRQLLQAGDTLTCPLFPGITTDIAALFP